MEDNDGAAQAQIKKENSNKQEDNMEVEEEEDFDKLYNFGDYEDEPDCKLLFLCLENASLLL